MANVRRLREELRAALLSAGPDRLPDGFLLLNSPSGHQRLIYVPPKPPPEARSPYSDDGRAEETTDQPKRDRPSPTELPWDDSQRTTLVEDDGNTVIGTYLPMEVGSGEEPPRPGWRWHPLLGAPDRREGDPPPAYVPPEVRDRPRGTFATSYIGDRPRAKTMAEVQRETEQAMARHPSSFGAPGSPGDHPEFDRPDRLRLVESEDGEPTYSR